MKTPRDNPKDPRFRGFRIAMYAVYLTLVGTISLLVINSVVRSVISMSPSRPESTDTVLTVRECLDLADDMFRDIEDHRRRLTDQPSARRADDAWGQFRVKWLSRKRETEAKCALESRSRAPVRDVYDRLERVMDLYTIHATQYAGEIGFKVDELKESMRAAREDASAGRLP